MGYVDTGAVDIGSIGTGAFGVGSTVVSDGAGDGGVVAELG